MEFNPIVFKFEEDKNEYSFEESLCFTNDKKLVKTLMRENIKNGNSSLIIKSMNNLPIYDVIQIKVNVSDTGTFLINFDKEKFAQEIREKLIEKIKTLKDENEPTLELQKIKINKLIRIINEVEPMYVTFRPHGDIVISFDDFKSFEKTSFILIYLGSKEKEIKVQEKESESITQPIEKKTEEKIKVSEKPKNKKSPGKTGNFSEKWAVFTNWFKHLKIKGIKFKKPQIEFKLFTLDYLFILIFALLFSFGLYAGIYEVLVEESIAVFLFIMAVIFLGVLYYSFYSTTYKRRVVKYKNLKYWLLLFVFVGCALGLTAGYLITTFAMKLPEDVILDLFLLLVISIPVSLFLSLISPLVSLLLNYICKHIKSKK